MGKRIGHYHVRLDDGTMWSVDRDAEEHNLSLNWLLRYGSEKAVLENRLLIASLLSSYDALLCATQKRRNKVVREIRTALPKSVNKKKGK